jgi:hypothetical protein
MANRAPGSGTAGSGGAASSGGSPAGGSSGVGGAAGIGSQRDSSADVIGQAVDPIDASVGSIDTNGASVDAQVPDVASARDAGVESIASRCSPACGGATPLCDEGSATCKPIEVLALYTAYEQNLDLAHRSWVREANAWFPTVAQANGFTYQAIVGWEPLNTVVPATGRVVLFLDNRPVEPGQQASFRAYMEGGGAWIGFHVAAYTAMPLDWDWYFNQLLGSGAYNGNTWRPTSANLRVEDTAHPVAQGLGALFASAPNEWYAWKEDLRIKPNIKILCSIDPSSFPLGTGPVPTEIWYSGYYPVVWTNTNYKMLYVNMGHNDMDYEGGTNRQLSFAFRNALQNQMLLNAIKWLGGAVRGQ